MTRPRDYYFTQQCILNLTDDWHNRVPGSENKSLTQYLNLSDADGKVWVETNNLPGDYQLPSYAFCDHDASHYSGNEDF